MTVYPNGTERTSASNLNLVAGETRANLVTVAVGADRKVALYNNGGSIHLIADLAGYYAPDATGKYTPVGPDRLLDTRVNAGPRNAGPVGPGGVETLDLSQRVPASATAVTFNLTGTEPTAATFVTAWPTGTPLPNASNLNLTPGATSPNLVTVALGANRKVNLYNNAGNTHLIVDLAGFYTPDFGATFNPVQPTRILDTRDGTGGVTGPVTGGNWIYLRLHERVPESAAAVVVNATGTEASTHTFVSLYPDGAGPLGNPSNLNLAPGQTASNLVAVGTGEYASVRMYNNGGSIHLIADLAGYFAIPPVAPCTSKCVYAWGSNRYGQLGTGTYRSAARTPTQVYGLSDVKAITDGRWNGYALRTDGTVWGWGNNTSSQLGGWFGGDTVVPVQVHGLSNITAIDDGVALRADGTVWTWGLKPLNGGFGLPVQVPGLSNITTVASGFTASYAVGADGTLWAWGSNRAGELGIGAPLDYYTANSPVRVSGLAGVRSVAATAWGAFALKNDGTVSTWGDNFYGQLGNGTIGGISNVPVNVPGLTGVSAIAADSNHRFVVLANGTAWGWGKNDRGGLGNGQDCNSCNVATPVQVVGLSNARSVAGMGEGGYALDADGRVWAWGDDRYGELGPAEGGSNPGGHSTVPLRLSTPTGVSAIAGGELGGFALVP